MNIHFNMIPKTELYTTRQAAAYLNRSYDGLKLAIKKGRLTGFMPHSKLRLFTEQELDEFNDRWPKGARKEIK